MVGQYLSYTNKIVTVSILQKIWEVNKALAASIFQMGQGQVQLGPIYGTIIQEKIIKLYIEREAKPNDQITRTAQSKITWCRKFCWNKLAVSSRYSSKDAPNFLHDIKKKHKTTTVDTVFGHVPRDQQSIDRQVEQE